MANINIKLNLGCGVDYKKGWVNIDALADVNPDLVHDLRNKLPFKNKSVSTILCQDILEHFTKEELSPILADMYRVLQVDGELKIRVPNVNAIFEKFNDDQEVRNEFLYGTTSQTGVFGAHKVGFTPHLLIKLMMKEGLELVKIKEEETNFIAVFKKNEKLLENIKINHLTFINQTMGMGGAEVFNNDLLKSLKDNKIKIDAYTNHLGFSKLLKESRIVSKNIPVVIDIIGNWKGLLKALILFPYALWFYFKLIFNLKNKTDLILLTGFFEKIIVSPLAKLFGIPVVWIEFGPMESIVKKFFYLPKVLYRLVKDLPEYVLVPTENTKNHLLSSAKISLNKIKVIACGRNINLKKYQNIKEFKQPTIVCVSRLEKGKGQDLLIHAFNKIIKLPKICKEFPNLRLLIIGEGDFDAELKKIISENKLENSVELVGRVDDSLDYIKKSLLCVFPSVWKLEGFGLVAIEAMSLGKPIVAFNRGPTNEIISHEINGLLAKEGSVDDLVKNIIRLLESKLESRKSTKKSTKNNTNLNNNLIKKLGTQAKKDYHENYLMSNLVDNYINIFEDAKVSFLAKKVCEERSL